jgi:ribosome-binding ATPase YchF (GTP1/OBG family)
VRKGATALEAAGAIHSDLARGFVRAEWVPRESFLKVGGWEAAKRAGAVRLVSRDHVLADGDILHIHFSV